MKKRILSLVVTAIMIAAFVPTALADSLDTQQAGETAVYTLSLDEAIKMAEQKTPDYISADITIENAERQLEQAQKDQKDLKGAIRLPAGLANVAVKQGYYVEQAKIGVESAIRAKKQLQCSDAYSITQQYYGVKLAEAVLENIKTAYKMVLDNKTTVDTQFSLGMVSELDVKNAQYSVNEMKASLEKSERNLDLARKSLAASLYIEEEDYVLNLTDGIEYEEFSAQLSEDISKAMENRLDIYQLKSVYTQAVKYTETTILLGNTSSQHSAANQAMISAETTYKNTMKLIGISINSAYNSVLDAKSELTLSEERLALRKQEYNIALVQYELGLITNSQLTAALSSVTSAQTELENAKLTYKLAVEGYKYEIEIGL